MDAAPQPDLSALLDTVVMLQAGTSVCAGAVVSPDGWIATAYHCVASGIPPEVRFRGRPALRGTIAARDPFRDLALVRVEATDLPWLPIRTEAPAVGERVLGIGHPYGQAATGKLHGLLEWSVSEGIVSAVGLLLLQTDTALNPGNSGGPLVDAEGRLVGIVSRKLRAEGIAFAARARDVATMLQEPEPGPWLGGTWGAGIGSWIGPETTSVEGSLHLTVRERAVARAWLGMDLDDGATRGALTVELRQRVGHGPLSTSFDVGGGVQLVDTSAEGILSARVAVAGLGLAARYAPDSENWTFGVDLEWPGTLGVW